MNAGKSWFETLRCDLQKLVEYFLLPFIYPDHFFLLAGLILRKRALVRELAHLTSYRLWFTHNKIETVIDVGSYIGAFAFAMQIMRSGVRLYAFEPLEENLRQLELHLRRFPNCQIFPVALGNYSGEAEFWRSEFPASSSVLPMGELHKTVFPHTASQVKEVVRMAKLDEYLSQMAFEGRVLLKLDVQGFERQVLEGAVETLKRVDYVLAEVSYQPLYQGQALFEDIYEFLRVHGFEYAGNFSSLTSPLDGTILQSDALFVRRGELFESS